MPTIAKTIPDFTGKKDRDRVYLEVRVERRKRWFATCNGFVCSIAHPRTPEIVEGAVLKVARRAFVAYWDDTPSLAVYVQVESEVRGFEYLASTARDLANIEVSRAHREKGQ